MRTFVFVFFVLFICGATSFNYSQVVGEIFDKDFANQEFGVVISFVQIENEKLDSILQSSGEYIMFNIESGKLRAIDSERESVVGSALSREEIFYNMSTSQVKLLINNGGSKITKVEMRPNTLTLTNGNLTLEMVNPCPPWCP